MAAFEASSLLLVPAPKTLLCGIVIFAMLMISHSVNGENTITTARNTSGSKFSFEIDYERDTFLLDGEPFRYVSGSFHYFRCPRQYWRDRFRKMRAAGLNAISTYVEWSFHEPEPNVWNWEDNADVVEFIKMAQEEDLFVLLRPGPFICSERDMGGLPYWLLSQYPDIKLRTNDSRYMKYVRIYLNKLLEKIQPLLRGNGGPIIMVQVENEYGSFYACDKEYLNNLRDIFTQYIGNKGVLYSTDNFSDENLNCSTIPGVYSTVDFGTHVNPSEAFTVLRRFEPKGPLVNSEFYPGWITHWEQPLSKVSTHAVVQKLDEILMLGASVNMLMFVGGTNFEFTSGANGDLEKFEPQITSYDFDSPISEAGDVTDKYYGIRNVISKYLTIPNITIPQNSTKGNYGEVILEPVLELFHPMGRNLFGTAMKEFEYPPTFEALELRTHLVLYEAKLPEKRTSPSILKATVADQALVYTDFQMTGILSRTENIYAMPLYNPYAKTLQILLENQGHINHGNLIADFKGIRDVNVNTDLVAPWNVTGFRLEDVDALKNVSCTSGVQVGLLSGGPVFLRGHFMVEGEPLDTFLDTSGWGKGVAYVNNNNLGRYWPTAGPQLTLYVPGTFLRTGQNEIVILELEYVPNTKHMTLQTDPIFK